MVPVLAYQLRMKPKSLPRVAVVGLGAGLSTGWAGVGLEVVATGGPVGAGCAGLGWGSAVLELPPHAVSVTAVRRASDATARRWLRCVTVLLLSLLLRMRCRAGRLAHVPGPLVARHRGSVPRQITRRSA